MSNWTPPLFGRQWDIFNSRKRYLLASGSRLSGKSIGVIHKICRHMWETPDAQVGIFPKSKGLAKEQGIWQDLINYGCRTWIDADIGFRYAGHGIGMDKPRTDGVTRTPIFSVRNYYGGISECRLFSVDHDAEVEDKVKNKRFSMIYFPELSMFKDRRILDVSSFQLRMVNLQEMARQRGEDIYHQWIADTNPDVVLGAKSWIYKLFYEEVPNMRESTDPEISDYGNSFDVIDMRWQDNPHLTDNDRRSLLNLVHDPALAEAYRDGIWGVGAQSRTRLFAPWFHRETHVVGQTEEDVIEVHPSSSTLFTGWDLGAVNHACALLDKYFKKVKDAQGNEKEITYWSVLDEHVLLQDRDESIRDFARTILDKMGEVEDYHKKKFRWDHYSDSSALEVWRPTSGSYDYLEIMAATKDRILLRGVEKPWGSVRTRIRLLRQLLAENRIFIASGCVHTIAMIEQAISGPIDKNTNQPKIHIAAPHKHIFDALTYPIYMESIGELIDESLWNPQAAQRQAPTNLNTVLSL